MLNNDPIKSETNSFKINSKKLKCIPLRGRYTRMRCSHLTSA